MWKLKYEENLIDSIYETEKNKSLVSATPLSTAFFSSSIIQDFQDNPDDEEDTRSNQEYLNDLEEEYQARALLAKSKRFFKKGTQRFNSTKVTNQTECHRCGKKGHFARDCWSKTLVSTSQSHFQTKPFSSPQHKPELGPTKDFEAKYNKVKAKLALLSSSASASKTPMVLMALAEENDAVSKESAKNVNLCISEQIPSQKKKILEVDQLTKYPSSSWLKALVFVKYSADNTKVTIPGVKRPWFFKAKGFILPNHDTGRILIAESQRNTTDPSVAFTDSSVTDYYSADESSVCSNPLPPLKKLEGVEPISGPNTIKLILKSKSTLKTEALKGVIINEPSSAPAKGNKISSASKVHSAHAGKLKSVKIKDDPSLVLFCKRCEKTDHRTCNHVEYMSTMNMSQHLKSLGRMSSRPNIPRPSKHFFPPCIHCGGIDHLSNEYLYYPICKLCESYDHDTNGHNRIISLEREINPRNPQHAFKKCEACGSPNHTTTDHYDIEWFKRGEALQAKKAEALKLTKAESSNTNRSKTPTKRHMIGVKSYLHKYVEQPGPKVVFGDDSTCTTEGYGSIQLRDVYVLDMTSSAQESCFFAKASENLNWLWHKRLAHLNFKTINKLAKQNLVIGLPSLASSIKKCLHLLHMDLFGPVTPRSINHEKYTLVIVDEYSRYTWVYFLKKKSQALETIMSFIKRVENQNDVKVKQLKTNNGTEFRNSTLVNFCDEKGISQNFSSTYTHEQNGVAERKNRTLIEAARTMLSGSVFSK
ncbi:retrovirus-related pol polyprotein from transposon TNT 1-94 [Tanacetum coccineum]